MKKNGKPAAKAKAKTSAKFKGTTHVMFVLDKSGSMDVCRAQTIAGFNDGLVGLQSGEGDIQATLTMFDTTCSTPFENTPIKDVLPLDNARYIPDGGTALLDAMMLCIGKVEPKVKKGDRALVIVVTDGEENSSRDATSEQVAAKIAELTKRGNWTFTYQSADLNAFAHGRGLGIAVGNINQYANTPVGTAHAGVMRGENLMAYASSGVASSKSFYGHDSVSHPVDVDPGQVVPSVSGGQPTDWVKPTNTAGSTPGSWTK
jgi:uncharacterized protein YegL